MLTEFETAARIRAREEMLSKIRNQKIAYDKAAHDQCFRELIDAIHKLQDLCRKFQNEK